MVNEQDDIYRRLRLFVVGAVAALAMMIGGVSACDVRSRAEAERMGARGYCRAGEKQGTWIAGSWAPCEKGGQ